MDCSDTLMCTPALRALQRADGSEKAKAHGALAAQLAARR